MSHFVKGLLKQKATAKPSSLKQADGTYTKTPEEALLELVSVHFPFHKHICPLSYNRDPIPTANIQNSFVTWITTRRIKDCLLQFKSEKAAGPDGIKPIVFSHMPEKYFEVIKTIYKAMIFTAFTPTKWKEAKVIFIPKPGKSSHQIAKDFRPISLTNHLLRD